MTARAFFADFVDMRELPEAVSLPACRSVRLVHAPFAAPEEGQIRLAKVTALPSVPVEVCSV